MKQTVYGAAFAAICILAVTTVVLWRSSKAVSDGSSSRPADEPSAPAATALPSATPTATPRPREDLPARPTQAALPEGDIRRNPEFRTETLQRIRSQRVSELRQFHAAFYEKLGLTDSQAEKFSAYLADYELWFFERSVFPGPDDSPPVHPTAAEVKEKRRELLEKLRREFGGGMAEQYRKTFPGPGDND